MADIEQWDRRALEKLMQRGSRYGIMADGRNAAGVRSGRFVVSEQARDDGPSRRF